MIKKIEGLDAVADTLEELWLSYNMIEKLNGVEMCKKLKNLYLSNNKIKTWDAIASIVGMSLTGRALCPLWRISWPWETLSKKRRPLMVTGLAKLLR